MLPNSVLAITLAIFGSHRGQKKEPRRRFRGEGMRAKLILFTNWSRCRGRSIYPDSNRIVPSAPFRRAFHEADADRFSAIGDGLFVVLGAAHSGELPVAIRRVFVSALHAVLRLSRRAVFLRDGWFVANGDSACSQSGAGRRADSPSC